MRRSFAPLALTLMSLRTACSPFDAGGPEGSGSDGGGTSSPVPATPGIEAGAPGDDASVGCPSGSTAIVVDAAVVSDGGKSGKCASVAGGVERSDNCHWVPQKDPLTFEFANSRCQQPDPKDHIATIGSAEENEFLVAAFPTCEDRWIGLSAASGAGEPVAGEFRWKNTSPDSFRAWASGFPRGPGRCVVLRPDGQWENRPCIEVHTVLCERE